MEKGLNIPDKGDYLKFVVKYMFIGEDSSAFEIPKGTLAKVIERVFTELGGDVLECHLVISLDITGSTTCYKFNYTIHQDAVDIIPEGKATKLLYGPKA